MQRQQHIYVSAKGEDFLTMDQWLRIKLTPEEYQEFSTLHHTDDRHRLRFQQWIIEEQIMRHKCIEDGVEIFDIEVLP